MIYNMEKVPIEPKSCAVDLENGNYHKTVNLPICSKPTIQKSDFSKLKIMLSAIEQKTTFQKTENERLKTGRTVTKDTITAYNETNTRPVIPEFEQKDSPMKALSKKSNLKYRR